MLELQKIILYELYRREKNVTNNGETPEQEFEGPPTSCKTLAKLGYTLNGFYLIKGINDGSYVGDKGSKIKMVYCRFKQLKFTRERSKKSFQSLFSNSMMTKLCYFDRYRDSYWKL